MDNLAEPPTNQFATPTEKDREFLEVLKKANTDYPYTVCKVFYAVDFAARLAAATLTAIENTYVQAGTKVDDERRLALLDGAIDSYAERIFNALKWLQLPSSWDGARNAEFVAAAKRLEDAIQGRLTLQDKTAGSA